MARKKESETLSQRKKAQQNFLDLKKMQKGEMATPPKPSEMAVAPRGFKEKLENYWYHFRWQITVAAFLIIFITVLVCQCAGKTNWDMNIVYFTYTPVMDEQTMLVADYFETICDDINGDGEVNVTVTNCSIPKDNSNLQYKNSLLSKLQALITAEPKAQLYITDSESLEYFEVEALENFFATEQLKLGDGFYEATESETLGKLPDGLQIACRNTKGTFLEKNKNVDKIYKECQRILKKLEQSRFGKA